MTDSTRAVPASELKVMLVDANPRRAALVESCLRKAGFTALRVVPAQAGLLHQIEQQAPDVIVIDLDSPGRDILESLSIVSTHNPTPIVMFSEEADPDFISQAVGAGVTAYVTDGIKAARVKPIIDVAMAQFRAFQALRTQLASTRTELADRKLVDQAKRALMKRSAITEEEAYAVMRKHAMDANVKLATVAQQILDKLARSGGGA